MKNAICMCLLLAIMHSIGLRDPLLPALFHGCRIRPLNTHLKNAPVETYESIFSNLLYD